MKRKWWLGWLVNGVLVGCALATAASFLGRFWWFFDIFSHFHLQYAWAIALVVVILALLRQWWPFAAALLLLSPHLVCLSYYAPVREAVQVDRFSALRVVAFNVLTSNPQHGEVLRFLQECEADVLLLVETDNGWLKDLRPLTETHSHIELGPRSDNFGMALYSRHPIQSLDWKSFAGGLPCLVARIDWEGTPVTVIGAHPYPPIGRQGARERDDYLGQLGAVAREAAADSRVLVTGDLNTTPWSPSFGNLVEAGGLIDSGKRRGFQSTWRRRNPVFSLPLDHVLHGPGLETIDRWIGPALGSDHRAVVVTLRSR